MLLRCSFPLGVAILLTAAAPASAQIVPVGPFSGDLSDNFSGYPQGGHPSLEIFGGFSTITALTPTGSIKIELSSTLGTGASADTVTPRSAPQMMGQLSVSEWVFDQPISHFGAYWENNSRFDNAEVEFFGTSGQLIGTATALVDDDAQAWTWNGWETSAPIGSIVVTGNDTEFLSGFIWYEDAQLTLWVPEPISAVALGGAAVLALARRRRAEG